MKKEEFSFWGHNVNCSNTQPHPPHKCGSYSTIRYGELSRFCEGKLSENQAFESYVYSQGCACTPTKLKCTIITFSSKEEKEEWEKLNTNRKIKYIPRHDGSCA